MKKLLKYLLIVLLSVGVFDVLVSFVLDKNINKVYVSTITETYDAESDIAIIGASRAIHHYNPQILQDSLKLTAHVYGAGGQNVYFHYTVLNALMEHSKKKPKLVLLELSAIDVYDSPKWNTEKLNILFPYYHNEPVVKDVLTDVLDNKELFFVRISGLYRHNSKFLTYIKNTWFGTKTTSNNGYIPLKNIWTKPIQESEKHDRSLDYQKVAYIDKIIDLCQRENITLIFTISPHYTITDTNNWKNELIAKVRSRNVQIIDYEQDIYFLEHGELFNEPFHLNEVGVAVYNKMVISDLKKVINAKKTSDKLKLNSL